MVYRVFLLFILGFFIPRFSSGLTKWGEDGGSRRIMVLGTNYGAIWAHNPPVYHLAQSHPWQISVEYLRHLPKKEWSRVYRYPYFGTALQYVHYRSPELGSSIAGIVFLEPKIYNRFRYRIGTGLVFNTKPFNLESNQTNNMLGGRLALVMHIQVNYYQTIGTRQYVRLGMGLTHFSNGAFKQPNSGINNFFIGVAWCYSSASARRESALKTEDTTFRRGFSGIISGSFSVVEKFPVNGPKYPVYHASGRAQYRIGRKSSLGVGLDYIRNMAIAQKLKEEPQLGTEIGRVGFVFGHEMHISKVSMLTELGIYIRKKQSLDPGFYHRIGLRYSLSEHIFAGMYLKTHKARAECIEWSLGARLGKL